MLSLVIGDLMREIRDGRERAKGFLEQRVDMVKRFAGPFYHGGGDFERVSPDNYPFAYKTFVKPQLLFGRPSCLVTAQLEITDAPIAQAVEAAVNAWASSDDVKDVLSETVDDCFFGWGASKVCVAEGGDAEYQPSNAVYAERIPPADLIIDARAKNVRQIRLIGHQFERDLDDVRGDPRYDAQRTALLTQFDMGDKTADGDAFPFHPEALRKRVVLIEVYVPEHKRILTLADKGGDSGVILRNEPYEGPAETRLGPYQLWGLESVAGELYPISPLQALWDEFLAVSEHGADAARNAETHKKIGIYANANKSDARNIQKANSGEMVGVQDPASVKDFEIGGASETQISWIQYLREKLDRNLGLGDAQRGVAGNRTATGEQIAAGNSDVRIDAMRDRMSMALASVFRAAGWYFFHESSLAPMSLTVRDPGTGEPGEATFISGPWNGGFVNNQFVPPRDEPDFSSLRWDIDVRSMSKTDDALEQKRAQDELMLAMRMQQMGFPVNWRRVLDRYGSAFNVRGYSKIILLDQTGRMIPPDPTAAPRGMAQQMVRGQPRDQQQLPAPVSLPTRFPLALPGLFANARG